MVDIPMTQARYRLEFIERNILESSPELREDYKKKRGKDSRPTTSNSGKKKPAAGDIQSKIGDAQASIEKEQQTIERLKQDMVHIQDRYIKREKEYRKKLAELDAELRARDNRSSTNLANEQKNQDKIDGLHGKIQNNMGEITSKTARILREQEKDLVRTFNSRMSELQRELENEKKKKFEGIGNFAEKESQLNRELDLMRASTELIQSKNQQLAERNDKLKNEFQIQENDRDLLLKQLVGIKRENARLKEDLSRLKDAVQQSQEEAQSQMGEEELQSQDNMSVHSHNSETERRYNSTVLRLQKILEVERKKLRGVRNSYAKEIASRTELENMLRKTVTDVKDEIKESRTRNTRRGLQEIELTVQDRERIIETLLSQETVLSLLYEKAFPGRAGEESESQDANYEPGQDYGIDMEGMEDEEESGFSDDN